MTQAVLDHVVVDVREDLDAAASLFRRLGFSLTARGYHTLGSANHLAIFRSNYLELLGWEHGTQDVRAELLRYPVGLNGVVFRADDAGRLCTALREDGLPAQDPLTFSRPVRLPNGGEGEAQFRTVRFEPGTFGATRMYFCEHLTPELVWRREWSAHPNGALDVVRLIIQAEHPHRLGTLFATMFGEERTRLEGDGCTVQAENARIEIMTRADLHARFRDTAPNLAGRDEAPAVLTLHTSSLSAASEALRSGELPSIQTGDDRLVVPAQSAMNVTIEFVS
jgi:glyoxalase-like protein